MSVFARWMFLAVLGLLAMPVHAQYYGRQGEFFVCKSSGYQQNYCGADTRNGVRMTRQISNSACIEGRSWGYDRRGVWVSNGCEAEFMVGGRVAGPIRDPGPVRGGRVIRCESNDYQQEYCRADTRGGVWLQRQVSNSDCVRGRSWGFDNGGVWVSDGCKGDFAVGNGWGNGGMRPPLSIRMQERVVRCESTNGRTVRCGVDTRGGVRVASQLSNSSCIQGRSWGWDRNGIWVSNGCRADFRVGGYYR